MSTAALALCAIIVLLALSAFFAGSETALTAVSRGKMFQLEKEGSRRAASVNKLIGERERMIGAILLVNTFLNILSSSIATSVLEDKLGSRTVPIATAVMTIAILIFAEVLPKTLAIARTDRFALTVALPVRWTVSFVAPIVSTVQFVVWNVLRLFGIRREDAQPAAHAHEEIRGTVDLHHAEGAVEREHRDMIGGVLNLRELNVSDIMTHRKNMVTVDASLPPREMFDAVLEARHLRVPVWRDQPENIVGILNLRDVIKVFSERNGEIDNFDFMSLAAPAWFVPETTGLEEQLEAFRERRSHFALVVDEYGVLQGLVTFEDIVDEIFGEIPDQDQAKEPSGIRPQPDGSYNIDGSMPIREINRALDWNLPDEEAATIAGLVIHEARTIPEVGQRFAFYGYQFEVLRRQRNQITAIRVVPPAKASVSSGS
ncbi:MAG TPA: HlyC/CorC family transporter [Rhizomicrobium sp.]|nr:HlyC/CorC family transporter [Rhizomicrobium sp.]